MSHAGPKTVARAAEKPAPTAVGSGDLGIIKLPLGNVICDASKFSMTQLSIQSVCASVFPINVQKQSLKLSNLFAADIIVNFKNRKVRPSDLCFVVRFQT
jgi:hypothetical protein